MWKISSFFRLESVYLKETTLNLLSRTGNYMNTIRYLSTPLPLGTIMLAININWKLATNDPELKGMILNLFSRTGNYMNNYMNAICDLSMPLPLVHLVSYRYQSEARNY